MNIETNIRQAYGEALADLEEGNSGAYALHQRHPLAPAPKTRRESLTIMRRAAKYGGRQWVVLCDEGYYIVALQEFRDFWSDAAVVAQSHCDTCGALLTEELTAFCEAHERKAA